jgi:AcrR family transcriptional regulator
MTDKKGEPRHELGSIQDARHEMYRQQILTAAEIEFSGAGFSDTKMSAIARTAGLSLATVYKTFGGKTEIWDALHTERMRALLSSVEADTQTAESELERLLSGVASVARFLMGHQKYLDMSIQAGAAWASNTDVGRGVQATVWSAGLDMLTASARAALDAGQLPDIRPRVAAGMVVSALQVWLSDWVSSGRDRDPEEVVAEMTLHLQWMLTGDGSHPTG